MQAALSRIVHWIIRMNISDTCKSDWTKGAHQSFFCSMEYSSFIYIYRAPSFNNVVYIISILPVLIPTAEGQSKQKIDCVILTIFSCRLPVGNLLILTQNVRGAGNNGSAANLLIFIYDNFFCATLLCKLFWSYGWCGLSVDARNTTICFEKFTLCLCG